VPPHDVHVEGGRRSRSQLPQGSVWARCNDLFFNFAEKIGVFYSEYCYVVFSKNYHRFWRKAQKFFAKNWRKSQKIVIITSDFLVLEFDTVLLFSHFCSEGFFINLGWKSTNFFVRNFVFNRPFYFNQQQNSSKHQIGLICPKHTQDSAIFVRKVFVTTHPILKSTRHVEKIVTALTKMTEDCKRHFRLKARYLLDR
jgi:hypothetical protein